MKITKTSIPDLIIIEPKIHNDIRGHFFESYNKKELYKHGLDFDFVQDNRSRSTLGTLRGLHYQLDPFAQTKLVSVIKGEVFDVAVDIRRESPFFGEWFGVVLSEENNKQLLIPKGFAHGFVVLSKVADFFYKCDNFYSSEHERGIKYNDNDLNIDWHFNTNDIIISEKDSIQPSFKKAEITFLYKSMSSNK